MSESASRRLAKWQRVSEWPLNVAALVFLAAYAWAVIGDLRPPDDVIPETIMTATWVLFGVDYVMSLWLAPRRTHWFLTHIPQFLIMVLPALRPLRLLRLVRMVGTLHRTFGNVFRGRVTLYVSSASALLVLVAGLAVLDAEQNAEGANITTFADALWWAFVTITTVGYGDYYPVTGLGRLIAVGLMISGIALIGTVTATIASWFVDQINAAPARAEKSDAAVRVGKADGQ